MKDSPMTQKIQFTVNNSNYIPFFEVCPPLIRGVFYEFLFEEADSLHPGGCFSVALAPSGVILEKIHEGLLETWFSEGDEGHKAYLELVRNLEHIRDNLGDMFIDLA